VRQFHRALAQFFVSVSECDNNNNNNNNNNNKKGRM